MDCACSLYTQVDTGWPPAEEEENGQHEQEHCVLSVFRYLQVVLVHLPHHEGVADGDGDCGDYKDGHP